jgi:hypothetical protein
MKLKPRERVIAAAALGGWYRRNHLVCPYRTDSFASNAGLVSVTYDQLGRVTKATWTAYGKERGRIGYHDSNRVDTVIGWLTAL